MKLKINKIFNFLKPKDKNINFLKHKNIILGIFAAIFVGLLAIVSLTFVFSEKQINFKQKKTVELPFKEPLDDVDLTTIKKISSNKLKTACTVQKTIPLVEEQNPQKNTIKINFYDTTYNEENTKEKIQSLVEELKKNFGNTITISNKEEILIHTEETANIEDFYDVGEFVAVGIVLCLITLYFLIAFRKLNGLLVTLSNTLTLIYNLTVTLALFLILSFCFNIDLNMMSLVPISAIGVIVLVVQLFNANNIFKNLKNIIMEKNKEMLYLTASNDAINKSFGYFKGNYIIFTVLPTIAALIFFVINALIYDNFNTFVYYLPYLLIYFIAQTFCFLISIYVLTPLWATLKRKKV